MLSRQDAFVRRRDVKQPKIGTSWLALDICIAVAAGRFCLGDRKPAQGDVLYCAMEDNRRRLQRRIDKLLSPVSAQWPERLTLTNSWRRLDRGGVDDIRQWIEHAADPRLIVLDTLASVRPIRTVQATPRITKAWRDCTAWRTTKARRSSSCTTRARWKPTTRSIRSAAR
jgi:AAA domain-containing protein